MQEFKLHYIRILKGFLFQNVKFETRILSDQVKDKHRFPVMMAEHLLGNLLHGLSDVDKTNVDSDTS